MIVIKNGMVTDPSNGIQKQAAVIIKDGKINKITDDADEIKQITFLVFNPFLLDALPPCVHENHIYNQQ